MLIIIPSCHEWRADSGLPGAMGGDCGRLLATLLFFGSEAVRPAGSSQCMSPVSPEDEKGVLHFLG